MVSKTSKLLGFVELIHLMCYCHTWWGVFLLLLANIVSRTVHV